MEEDTWTGWILIWIVGLLLGYAVGSVADAATGAAARSVFLGIMTGVAFITWGLRQRL